MASQAQIDLIVRMASERSEALAREENAHILNMQTDTYRQVQEMISALKKIPRDSQATPSEPMEPGIYKMNDEYYILFKLEGYSGLVGRKWTGERFVKAPGASRQIRANGRKATEDEIVSLSLMAGKIGIETRVCQFCARPLTDNADGHSISRGYGPTCASKYNLPWG